MARVIQGNDTYTPALHPERAAILWGLSGLEVSAKLFFSNNSLPNRVNPSTLSLDASEGSEEGDLFEIAKRLVER